MTHRGYSESKRHFPESNRNLGGSRLRMPIANGIFYPDNREALIDQLSSWRLKEGSIHTSFGSQVIIAPHGAWNISGAIAGAVFAAVQAGDPGTDEPAPDKAPLNETQGRGINRVILLGPCHGSGEQGIYLSESDSFQTPLGDLPVDSRLNRKLTSCSTLIKENDILHLSEHSLEVHLPIVKYCFPDVKIIPILVHGNRPALISGLAMALKLVIESYMDQSLVVISSTVSQNGDPALAFSMADEFRSLLSNMDAGAFLAGLAEGRVSPCGGPIIAALLESGLLEGKHFSALTPLSHETEKDGMTVYYGGFVAV